MCKTYVCVIVVIYVGVANVSVKCMCLLMYLCTVNTPVCVHAEKSDLFLQTGV